MILSDSRRFSVGLSVKSIPGCAAVSDPVLAELVQANDKIAVSSEFYTRGIMHENDCT